MSTPTQQDLQRLWDHCAAFIQAQNIWCPESVYQSDRVAENSFEMIEGVCDIVGYAAVDDVED